MWPRGPLSLETGAELAHMFYRVPNVRYRKVGPPDFRFVEFYSVPPGDRTSAGPDHPAAHYEDAAPIIRAHFFAAEDAEWYEGLLFSPESLLIGLLPVLFANAYLTIEALRRPRARPFDALPPLHLELPKSEPTAFTDPSGESVYLERHEIAIKVAHWQLELEGWKWDEKGRTTTRRPEGRGRPKTLRRVAIEALSLAWDDLEEPDRIDFIRKALRWFFDPAALEPERVRKAIYDLP